jgi:Na+/H+ antiporter NhaD/arsenite permease-like protein
VPPGDALRFIDFPTLVLLFSMMLIVGTLHLVGFFEWNAEMILRSLKPSRLLPAVVFTSGVLHQSTWLWWLRRVRGGRRLISEIP